jgi:hypothetical protein
MRLLLSSRKLGPTLWIWIEENKDIEKRFFEILNLDLLDKIFWNLNFFQKLITLKLTQDHIERYFIDKFSSLTLHFLSMHHKIFTCSLRSTWMEEINQKRRF